jgi:hypothetical protein
MARRKLSSVRIQEQPVRTDRRNVPSLSTLERLIQFDEEFTGQWNNFFNAEQRELAGYLRKIALRLYLSHRYNKPLHKMDACRLIPLHHAGSARKYIDMAVSNNLVKFIQDPNDARKTIVTPTQDLIDIVEAHLLKSHEKLETLAKELFEIEIESTDHY